MENCEYNKFGTVTGFFHALFLTLSAVFIFVSCMNVGDRALEGDWAENAANAFLIYFAAFCISGMIFSTLIKYPAVQKIKAACKALAQKTLWKKYVYSIIVLIMSIIIMHFGNIGQWIGIAGTIIGTLLFTNSLRTHIRIGINILGK
jgi:hypothetical protein